MHTFQILGPIGLNKGVLNLICTISWGNKHDSSSSTNLHSAQQKQCKFLAQWIQTIIIQKKFLVMLCDFKLTGNAFLYIIGISIASMNYEISNLAHL